MLLGNYNLLFLQSIQVSKELILKKGKQRDHYTRDDRVTIMTCMNMAAAIKKIIDVPVLNREGQISYEMKESIRVGIDFFGKVNVL